MKKENIQLSIQRTRTNTAVFFRWWFFELADMVPREVKTKLISPATKTIISFKNGRAAVCELRKGQQAYSFASAAGSRSAGAKPDRKSASIALSEDDVFTGSFRVPASAQTRLRQAVSYEIKRRSPFRDEDALFDFTAGFPHDDGSLTVDWATIPHALAEQARNAAKGMGYFPLSIGLLPEAGGDFKYVFFKQPLPLSLRMGKSTRILGAAFLILLCSFLVALSIRSERLSHADFEAAALKAEAMKAESERTAVEQTTAAISKIAARINDTRVIDIIQEVTRTLPDDSWVNELSLNGDQLRLVGYSSSASSLIEKFSAVSVFEHPHFQAPITPQTTPQSNKVVERFDIAMTIQNRSKTEVGE